MTKEQTAPVAVIGADSPIGLTVIRELGEMGLTVIAFGKSEASISRNSRHTAYFEKLKRPLAEHLPAQLKKHGVKAVFAISEHDLVELAPLKGKLGDCRLLIPDAGKLAVVLDKQKTLARAKDVGILIPPGWQPQKGDDFAGKAAALEYPVAIKWANPEAVLPYLQSRGIELEKVEYADDADGLLAILSRYDAVGQWPLVQYRCPGYGLGQMFHMHDGKASLVFQHRRLREWPPTGGVSTFCKAEPLDAHGEQLRLSETLLRSIGWEGPAMVEYRYDAETDRYWLMEINGRFWGSLPLAYHCGVHFAQESYRLNVAGEAARVQAPYPIRKGRYVIPDAKHLAKVLVSGEWPLSQKIVTLFRFFAGYLDFSERYYVWNSGDPRPFFDDIKQAIAKVFGR